ncbi:transglutaminase family protein [Rubrimonas cliftonensis]|uniref:Transglutaminase-like enzyme, putative cysteine protease n=1 Tax=Rubrimonas cliftonensis TaxID=89524 RepID=A0A1H3VJF4_9RHOB|nr:transglutaminase family protein [Rubrimonas cliftonensis]SDZ74906.1 Transglutaminase-like enzyme, putative cysteine protease [Rubrimonas cliftonensis]
MIYSVRHKTIYRYADPVTLSSHRLRLSPRTTPRQSVRRFRLEISPASHTLVAERDPFGNAAHLLEIRESHAALSIEARSVVEVQAEEPELGFTPWEAAVAAARAPEGPNALAASGFAFPSHYTGADDALEDFARESFAPGRPVLEAARDLTARIFRDFAYDPAATDAATTAKESCAARAGVCQDFAHVFLAGCRALGVPARYVSGYLLTRPPEGQEKLVGADASHAWVSVWCPVAGWVDFDPTNDCIPGLEHVTCAWGRDYGDVGPVTGVVLGGGGHTLEVAVDVSPVAEPAIG